MYEHKQLSEMKEENECNMGCSTVLPHAKATIAKKCGWLVVCVLCK